MKYYLIFFYEVNSQSEIIFAIISHMEHDSIKTKVVRFITVALLLIVVTGGLAFAWPNYRRSQSLRAQSVELDAQIIEKRAAIADLKDRQRRFKTDPDFVESIARQNRRVYPGELVFVFDEKK